jgi:hypothetical protein
MVTTLYSCIIQTATADMLSTGKSDGDSVSGIVHRWDITK